MRHLLFLISGLIAFTPQSQLQDEDAVFSVWRGDGKSVENTVTAKNTLRAAPDGDERVAEELGPDSSPAAGQCAREGCISQPTGSVDPSKWNGELENKSGTTSDETNFNEESKEDLEGTSKLVEVPRSKPFFGFIGDIFSNGIQTAKDQIYGKTAKVTSDFADKVREAVHDELNGFLWSVFASIGMTVSSPGTYLKYLYTLSESAMTATIFLSCLLLTYIFLRFFSVLFIITFNCSVFLCYELFGPKWIFDQVFWISNHSVPVMKFMAENYIPFVTMVVVIFAYALIMPILHWFARVLLCVARVLLWSGRVLFWFISITPIRHCFARVTPSTRFAPVLHLFARIPPILHRFAKTERQRREEMFANVADLCRRMGEIEERQQEMLRILRDLDNERRMREEER